MTDMGGFPVNNPPLMRYLGAAVKALALGTSSTYVDAMTLNFRVTEDSATIIFWGNFLIAKSTTGNVQFRIYLDGVLFHDFGSSITAGYAAQCPVMNVFEKVRLGNHTLLVTFGSNNGGTATLYSGSTITVLQAATPMTPIQST